MAHEKRCEARTLRPSRRTLRIVGGRQTFVSVRGGGEVEVSITCAGGMLDRRSVMVSWVSGVNDMLSRQQRVVQATSKARRTAIRQVQSTIESIEAQPAI